ncbi:MAG: Coenzyme PQQ synthesis protein E [Phycisphaerae bacterium]|nr:Coenzyme PQQ synthesis protein E [Phycisphaerae bacterium]
MKNTNIGLCNECRGRVPSEFFTKNGQTWIRKTCPKCGVTESLVSGDAEAWTTKRQMWDYVSLDRKSCAMHCDKCHNHANPNIVFLDVTNRCNMNCPICIATIKGMGFDFNPPMEYFHRVFSEVSKLKPNPVILLFGGEPTVRDDLPEIIGIARSYGLKPHIVTNGIRLADEEYAKKICEINVGMRFGFDGRNREIYEKLRHQPSAYDKKMKALENLIKYSRRKHTIIVTAGKGFNDKYLPDLFQYCHDNRDLVSDIGLIPLTENWEPGAFDAGVHTTMEDVEKMVAASITGGNVEFIPAGLSYALKKPRLFFRHKNPRSEVLLLAGVHPNCESMTLLISDGKTYRSLSNYLRKPLSQVAVEFAAIGKKIEPKLDKLDPQKFFQRQRGRLIVLSAFVPWAFRRIRLFKLMGNPLTALWRTFFGRPGRRSQGTKKTLRRSRRIIRVAMLPFEEEHSIDAARLEKCRGLFAYEDTADGQVKYIPACLWYPYRNAFLEKLSNKYGVVNKKGQMMTCGTAADGANADSSDTPAEATAQA